MTRHRQQPRLTPRQRSLLQIVRSFGPRGGTARQIQLRRALGRRAREQKMRGRRQDYTERAAAAVVEAAQVEHDFGGWLASVLAAAAAELGSSRALIARRPGSWEADLVIQLVCGTVGWDDEYLQLAPDGDAQ